MYSNMPWPYATRSQHGPTECNAGPMCVMLRNEQVTELAAIALQFLSSRELPSGEIRFPAKRPGTQMVIECSVIEKPFDIAFASISGKNPDIGAAQYVDLQDHYADSRWPTCVLANVSIETTDDLSLIEVRNDVLLSIREIVYSKLADNPLFVANDHISKRPGYRRSYVAAPNPDIFGTRRPRPSENYHPTTPGEFHGPGLICLDGTTDFVWSQIIPFPSLTDIATDLPRLREIVQDMRLHFNSYNELIDARRHLDRAQTSDEIGDIKAAIRSAASGVDPLLRFYCKLHSIRFPSRSLPFDQKVEEILARTGMPSYRAVSPHGMEGVAKLYRARNSMHEGDRYFTDGGVRLTVDYELAKQFVEAAEQFAIWLDSLA